MVTKKMDDRTKKFIFNIKIKIKRLFPLLGIIILVFSPLTVYYHAQGNSSNLSLRTSVQEHTDFLSSNFVSKPDNNDRFQNISGQAQENYTVPITFTSSSQHLPRDYCYQQFIVLNRASIPEINSNFSNFYFSYSNGTGIYAWIMNVTGNNANIWLKLNFQPILTIYLNIGPEKQSLFGKSSFLGFGTHFFNAPLVFGNSTSPNAWDFAGSSLPAGFVNENTNYTVDDGLYISGETAHYGEILIPGTYSNDTGILTDMQISSNGHSRVGQVYYYMVNGTKTFSENFWFVDGSYFAFASENRGPINDTYLRNYNYNIFGINDSLSTDTAYGTYNGSAFSNPEFSSIFDVSYYLGSSYDEQYANYSWVVIRTLPTNNVMPVYSFGIIEKTYTVIFKSENLPSTTTWVINIADNQSVEAFSSSKPEFKINLPNGTYSYAIGNSSKYYPIYSEGAFKLNGNPILVPIKFNEFGFLEVISTPWSSLLTINGRSASYSEWIYNNKGFLESGIYNGTLLPGNYTIKIEDIGYLNFSVNVNLSSGELSFLNVTLKPVKNNSILLIAAPSLAIASVAIGLIYYSFYRRKNK